MFNKIYVFESVRFRIFRIDYDSILGYKDT